MIELQYTPIGVVHSPFKEPQGTPIQPKGGKGIEGMVEVLPEYAESLKDLEGFSHILLVYHFHLTKGYSLQLKPYLDDKEHGVFATRAVATESDWHFHRAARARRGELALAPKFDIRVVNDKLERVVKEIESRIPSTLR